MLLGFLISLTIVMIAMPSFIKYLKKFSFKQSVSEYALEDDKKKAGTPIMGGMSVHYCADHCDCALFLEIIYRTLILGSSSWHLPDMA
jgi:UDP-N-acetylmuramyl pentapeptide phosphotransferase/UDP-N-acetylglucosamine-1-phosphate transferase